MFGYLTFYQEGMQMNSVSSIMCMLCIGILLFGIGSPVLLADDFQVRVVGVVEQASDPVTIQITEIVQSPHDLNCDTVTLEGIVPPVSSGDTLYVSGEYHSTTCVISVEETPSAVRIIPPDATSDDLTQSLHCAGRILRIFEMEGERFFDISVTEVFVVTYQEQEMCATITVKVDPVAGFVEEGLEPGDSIEFFGTYDETLCMGSLDWYEDYLRKERKTGISWILVIGGCVGYLISRNR